MQIFKKIFKGNTLFYPGCLTKLVLKDILENYQKILEKEKIEYIMLKDKEFCCGSPLKNSGMEREFLAIAEKNLKVFKDHGVDRIISNCPACVAVLRIDYKKMLGKKWDIQVQHMTEIIKKSAVFVEALADKGGKGSRNLKNGGGVVTYHDPCHLGRTLGCYDQPREIIKKAGYEIKEMELTRQKAFCCGGGGGSKSNNPELANRIAKDRSEQARKTGAKILVTPCPMCYANLKENSDGIDVREMSQII